MANWQLIAGGGLQGLGAGITQQGVALREAKLAELDRMSRERRETQNREFQTSEREAGEAFRTKLEETRRSNEEQDLFNKQDFEYPLQQARINLLEAQTQAATDPTLRNTSAAVEARKDLARIYAQAQPKAPEETDEQFKQRVASFILQTETQRAGMSDTDINARAIQAAQKDYTWDTASPEDRQKLVASYATLLRGRAQTAQPAAPSQDMNAQANADAMKAIEDGKISRDEARKRLLDAGYTPTF